MARKRMKIFKFNQNPLLAQGTKVGAGVGTNYGMAFLDKRFPFLSKNQWLTPTSTFVVTLMGISMTKPESFWNNAFDGANIISGVDTVNAIVDISMAARAARNNQTQGRLINAKKRMAKSKNVSVPYVNVAR